ncbi:alpha/beta hydrolase family protein [Ceratobasidium sp. AG-Ba]|nr:alpha/beta hydrolase family protein [Ceratobasidium sp. AG-Ba]
MLVDTLVALCLFHSGFRHYTTSQSVFPSCFHTNFSSQSPSETLSYWYRPSNKSGTEPALLFLHGIGIGLFPYAPMLISYSKKHPERPIIIPELLYISSRLTSPPPPQSVFQDSIHAIFKHHKIKDYSLVAHSYGTGLATSLIKPSHLVSDHPPNNLQPPSSVILLDPISILLHLPSVARNFLYRLPKSANEHELYYFACTDPGVAHTLTRHFFWTEHIIWKEELANIGRDKSSKPRVAVVLSGKDIILDAPTIWTYLTGLPPPTDQSTNPWPFVPPTPHPSSLVPIQCQDAPNILAMYFGGLDHAQMFLSPTAWRAVIDIMDQVSGGE